MANDTRISETEFHSWRATINQLGQYANSPGIRAYCYAELVISSLAVALTIAI